MGTRGPAPKRSSQRHGHRAKADRPERAPAATRAPQPPAPKTWHRLVRTWYGALAESGQSRYYEPSDWAAALLLGEAMSRELKPKSVGVIEVDGQTRVIRRQQPPSAAAISSWIKGWTTLMTTEADRRRLRLELERPSEPKETDVVEIGDYRKRLTSG